MKKIFVISLSMMVVLCFSCNRYQSDKIEDELSECQSPFEYDPFIVKPLNVDVGTSFIKVSCEIKSGKEGDAYIVIQLEQGSRKGFGDNVLIEGYEIFGHYLMLDHDNITYSPPTEFPAFIKKVKLPENKSFIEEFTIHFPDEFTEIIGGIFILRNNKDIERYMNTKLYPDFYKDLYSKSNYVGYENVEPPPVFDHYCKLFPESSVFTYLCLHDRGKLPFEKRENVLGYYKAIFCWPPDRSF